MNIDLAAQDDEKELLKLKDSMSDQQRSDMAEIIQNELKRREGLAKSASANKTYPAHKSSVKSSRMSSPLDSEDLEDIYKNSDKNIQELRVRSLEKRLQEAKKEVSKLGLAGKRMSKKPSASASPSNSVLSFSSSRLPAIFILMLVLGYGGLRYAKDNDFWGFSNTGNLLAYNKGSRASLRNDIKTDSDGSGFTGGNLLETDINGSNKNLKNSFNSISSPIERGLLLQLDNRRTELEKRKQILDEKEGELMLQSKMVSEKVAELKTLVSKLSSLRKEKDHKYSARMEQLASVYSAMAPKDAANLIGKLDDEVALGLLERMTGKRMAQILGMMNQERALELTKSLTNKRAL